MNLETIVVGFDGSTCSRAALESAISLASDDTVVHVVTAYKPPSVQEMVDVLEGLPPEYRSRYDPVGVPQGYLEDAEQLLELRGVTHKGHLVEGNPAEAILDQAEDCAAGLIVVGSRGLGRVSRFVRGSVSSRVCSHATTDFLVVHEPGDD